MALHPLFFVLLLVLLQDDIADVLHIQRLDPLAMFLRWESLGETIGHHLICWHPIYSNLIELMHFTQPMLLNINMHKTCRHLGALITHNMHYLEVVIHDMMHLIPWKFQVDLVD